MKRVGKLFDKLVSWENLLRAAGKARKGKGRRRDVAHFEYRREWELLALARQLRNQNWHPSPFRSFEIFEPKRRLISAAPYRDRVVHHAVCNVVQPVLESTFISDSYACRKQKGTHKAMRRARQFARQKVFVLQADIRQFFPSIDHDLLLGLLQQKLKDEPVLHLLETIVRHPWPGQRSPGFFPRDDLFSVASRKCGLPIGNQTSQFFGNLILNPLDQFVTRTLRIRSYVRYADDFLIFGDSSAHLHDVRQRVAEFLLGWRLRLNEKKTVVFPVRNGIPFLGYRIFPGRVLLARRNIKNMKQRLSRFEAGLLDGSLSPDSVRRSVISWWGHARHANARTLALAMLKRHPVVYEALLLEKSRARLRRSRQTEPDRQREKT